VARRDPESNIRQALTHAFRLSRNSSLANAGPLRLAVFQRVTTEFSCHPGKKVAHISKTHMPPRLRSLPSSCFLEVRRHDVFFRLMWLSMWWASEGAADNRGIRRPLRSRFPNRSKHSDIRRTCCSSPHWWALLHAPANGLLYVSKHIANRR